MVKINHSERGNQGGLPYKIGPSGDMIGPDGTQAYESRIYRGEHEESVTVQATLGLADLGEKEEAQVGSD